MTFNRVRGRLHAVTAREKIMRKLRNYLRPPAGGSEKLLLANRGAAAGAPAGAGPMGTGTTGTGTGRAVNGMGPMPMQRSVLCGSVE